MSPHSIQSFLLYVIINIMMRLCKEFHTDSDNEYDELSYLLSMNVCINTNNYAAEREIISDWKYRHCSVICVLGNWECILQTIE